MTTNRLFSNGTEPGPLLCYGAWTEEGDAPEACIAIQVDVTGAIVISQEDRDIVMRGPLADEVIAELRRIRKAQKDAEK